MKRIAIYLLAPLQSPGERYATSGSIDMRLTHLFNHVPNDFWGKSHNLTKALGHVVVTLDFSEYPWVKYETLPTRA